MIFKKKICLNFFLKISHVDYVLKILKKKKHDRQSWLVLAVTDSENRG